MTIHKMMRRAMGNSLLAMITWTALLPSPARADATTITTVQSMMRQKLEASHAILDALALGDIARIEQNAEQLARLSKVTTWYRQDVPDFVYYAKSFQNSADYLAEQAKTKNLEGVAMGYIRVVLGCLQCHNSVRAASKSEKK